MIRRLFQSLLCLVLLGTTLVVPSASAAPATPEELDQYWAWMVEAREMYPYEEPVEKMWSVMMCESRGDSTIVSRNRLYHGLFQYHKRTWAGKWNPYREVSIFDAKSQIFATAKAWNEGYQSWWGCYKRR